MNQLGLNNFPVLRQVILSVPLVLGFCFLDSAAFAADLAGCWTGCWRSDCNGHDGKLRATITKVDDTHYCARFSGDFWRVFPFRYSVMLTTKQEGDALKLEASKDLGPLFGGTFSFEGTATETDFKATYTSSRDRGEFNMKRLPPCNACCK